MDRKVRKFIDELVALLPQLRTTVEKSYEWWRPDEPQPIIILGDLGVDIFHAFEKGEINNRIALFKAIEDGMNDPDETFATAVATGLVEGIVTGGDKNPSAWADIVKELGPASASHANAWKNFGT